MPANTAELLRHNSMHNTGDLRMRSNALPVALREPLQMSHERVQFDTQLNLEGVSLSQRNPFLFYYAFEGQDRVPGGIPFITGPYYAA